MGLQKARPPGSGVETNIPNSNGKNRQSRPTPTAGGGGNLLWFLGHVQTCYFDFFGVFVYLEDSAAF